MSAPGRVYQTREDLLAAWNVADVWSLHAAFRRRFGGRPVIDYLLAIRPPETVSYTHPVTDEPCAIVWGERLAVVPADDRDEARVPSEWLTYPMQEAALIRSIARFYEAEEA